MNQLFVLLPTSQAAHMPDSGTCAPPAGTGSHRYTWDAESRLTSVSTPAGRLVATYTYNALGQRTSSVGSGVPKYEYYDVFGNLAMIGNSQYPLQDFFPPVAGRNYGKYQYALTYYTHVNAQGSTMTDMFRPAVLRSSLIRDMSSTRQRLPSPQATTRFLCRGWRRH